MERRLKYTLCHGSGNRFALIDGVQHEQILHSLTCPEFVRTAAMSLDTKPLDGLLFLVRESEEELAMRMYNTDGSAAEMCGNGIRCVARMARERYLQSDEFTLWSGGRQYPILLQRPIFGAIPTFGVDIALTHFSKDFLLSGNRFEARVIKALNSELEFMFLNPGNPHIVAKVTTIDYELLEELGQRVKSLKDIFPNGVNVSLFREVAPQRIFVATFERGVGLTASCGTAMTSSATASVLLGVNPAGCDIEVMNRGGMVRCNVKDICERSVTTRLIGNATYYREGRMEWCDGKIEIVEQSEILNEEREYELFVESISNL